MFVSNFGIMLSNNCRKIVEIFFEHTWMLLFFPLKSSVFFYRNLTKNNKKLTISKFQLYYSTFEFDQLIFYILQRYNIVTWECNTWWNISPYTVVHKVTVWLYTVKVNHNNIIMSYRQTGNYTTSFSESETQKYTSVNCSTTTPTYLT